MRALSFIALFLLLSFENFAQAPNYIFYNTGERQGLSANFCYRLLKDSRGMLWVGTVNGLSRFDGVHFNNFKAGKDSGSFINNEIFDLCEDKEGNIWGATASGIFRYNAAANSFKNYIPPTYDFARGVANIICDQRGDIWATTAWNILKLNKTKNSFEEIGPLTHHKDSLNAYSVRPNGLVEDPLGKGLWFATRSGLHFYNTAQQKFFGYRNSPGDSLFTNHSVSALSLAASGHFWFFDNVTKEIISFDPASHGIKLRIDMKPVIPGAVAQTLIEDSNHRLWFSSWNGKMGVIDYKKNITTIFEYKNDDPLTVAGEGFWDMLEDDDHNIWLATAGGISKCNYSKTVYEIVPVTAHVPQFKNSILGGFSLDPRDNSWWLAAAGAGDISVIRYYPETGKYDFYDFQKAVKNRLGQMPGPVFAVCFMQGQPYACTHTGVWQLNEKTKQVLPFEKTFEGMPFIPFNYFVEHGDEVWFTTKKGLIKWNRLTNQAINIQWDVDSLPDGQKAWYSFPFFDKTGMAWLIAGFGWLGHVTPNNEAVLKYYIKNKPKELAAYITSPFIEDGVGNLWLASKGLGLYKYQIATGEMKIYDQSDGISSSTNQVAIDNSGLLWTAAMNKFAVFNPVTNSISQFNIPVFENKMDYLNVLLKDSSGGIICTMYKDVVRFMPDRLNLKPVLKSPLLSSIKIGGKQRFPVEGENLHLEPDENSLDFNFGSLISNEIFPYSFEYRLAGFDKKWITANTDAAALYNNLSPGKYTFRVKAVAKDKSWQTPEKTIAITIRTPFYKAVWFWFLIGALLVTALILFYRFRLHKQKQIFSLETMAQQLEKEKTMVMYASLKQQLNPHFLFNSLTSLSGLIETDQEHAVGFLEQMSGIYRYILKNGDNETVSLKDEIAFVKLYIDLQQTRFKKGLQVNINIPDDVLHYKIAPVTLQNLIENAIKHNVIDATSPLVIDIFADQEYLVVQNNLQKKNMVETSNKKGLAQFQTLYRYLSDRPIIITESKENFTIKIPLV